MLGGCRTHLAELKVVRLLDGARGRARLHSGGAGSDTGLRMSMRAPPDTGTGAGTFQRSMLESVVEDVLSEVRVEMHRDVQNLHIDMLRQFELQQRHLVGALEQFTSRFASLVAENEALRNENEVLRNID